MSLQADYCHWPRSSASGKSACKLILYFSEFSASCSYFSSSYGLWNYRRVWRSRNVYKSVAEVSGHQKRNVAVLLNGQGFSWGEPHGFHSTKKKIHVANFTYPTQLMHLRLVEIAKICVGLGPFSLNNLPPPMPFSANLWTSPFHPLLCLRHNHAIFYWIVFINVMSLWLTFGPSAQKFCKALSFIWQLCLWHNHVNFIVGAYFPTVVPLAQSYDFIVGSYFSLLFLGTIISFVC